ncbi:MAG: hypothetical protein EBU08_06350 [Micrococcales bacterium]|nr:hypothetical protein [Micrococcales bacterium]
MFADGNIKVIKDDAGDLFINMWELTGHLLNSAEAMEGHTGQITDVSGTLRIVASTLCDLAMFELGKDGLDGITNMDDLVALWDSYRE